MNTQTNGTRDHVERMLIIVPFLYVMKQLQASVTHRPAKPTQSRHNSNAVFDYGHVSALSCQSKQSNSTKVRKIKSPIISKRDEIV